MKKVTFTLGQNGYECSERGDMSGVYCQSTDIDDSLQPIDTMPEDGAIVLVTDGDRWSDANKPPGYAIGFWRYHKGIGKWVGGSLQFKPTHWMQIPHFSS